MRSEFNIHTFDIRSTTDKEYAARNAFNNQMRAERFAEPDPIPLDEEMRGWRAMPELIVGRWFSVWTADEGELIAVGNISYMRAEENQHIANFDLVVSPSHRQQGIAKQLLARLAPFAREHGKRLMMCWTSSRIPAGDVFMRRIGAELGQAMHANELVLAELDCDLMRRWIARGEQNQDFTLGMWRGPIPDEDMPTMCQLFDVMNTMPRDDLDMEDWHITPEQLRNWEKQMAARGDQRWVLHARHVPSGELAGFTEIFWHPNRPHLVFQGGTGVWPHYRNGGLGRWLKAAMIETVLAETLEAQRVRTGNAHSNAPMLKINFEMGFKPHHAESRWQVATDSVFEYLAEQRELAMA